LARSSAFFFFDIGTIIQIPFILIGALGMDMESKMSSGKKKSAHLDTTFTGREDQLFFGQITAEKKAH